MIYLALAIRKCLNSKNMKNSKSSSSKINKLISKNNQKGIQNLTFNNWIVI